MTGSYALPNTSGVMINLGAKRTLVGGETTAAGNVISGNRETGLFINSTGTTRHDRERQLYRDRQNREGGRGQWERWSLDRR